MSIYIQQPDKLQKLTGEKLTRSKIIAALGYTPSTFSGDYNDLTNKPITEDESNSSSLYVQDSSGNIIALIDEKGLTTTDLNAGGTLFSSFVEATEQAINNLDSIKANKSDVSESITAVENRIDNITYDDIKGNPNLSDDGDYLEITDSNSNVLARFDSNGLTAASVITQQLSINGTDVTGAITGIEETLNDYDGRITTNKNDIAENKTDIEANKSAIESLEEIVSPSGLQFNSSEFSIQDTSGNTILKVDESGLTTTNITSVTTDNLQNQITTLANDIADVDQKADDINTDLSNHTSDTVKHITAAERSA
jgi:predicted  nucleic acid-binding Zn-ribbon protein